MTANECPKRVLHISMDVSNSGITFLPGDAAGVCPGNGPTLVDGLLGRLQIDGSQYAAQLVLATECHPFVVFSAAPFLNRACFMAT